MGALAQRGATAACSIPPTEYDAAVQMLCSTGAMLDDGMVYWDVRPSANFPTVEVRVADVPATVAETVLFAALVRALRDDGAGRPISGAPSCHRWRPTRCKAAYWKARPGRARR